MLEKAPLRLCMFLIVLMLVLKMTTPMAIRSGRNNPAPDLAFTKDPEVGHGFSGAPCIFRAAIIRAIVVIYSSVDIGERGCPQDDEVPFV